MPSVRTTAASGLPDASLPQSGFRERAKFEGLLGDSRWKRLGHFAAAHQAILAQGYKWELLDFGPTELRGGFQAVLRYFKPPQGGLGELIVTEVYGGLPETRRAPYSIFNIVTANFGRVPAGFDRLGFDRQMKALRTSGPSWDDHVRQTADSLWNALANRDEFIGMQLCRNAGSLGISIVCRDVEGRKALESEFAQYKGVAPHFISAHAVDKADLDFMRRSEMDDRFCDAKRKLNLLLREAAGSAEGLSSTEFSITPHNGADGKYLKVAVKTPDLKKLVEALLRKARPEGPLEYQGYRVRVKPLRHYQKF